MARRKLIHLHSAVKNAFPTIDTTDEYTLQYGELAVNYAKGSETIAIRNSNDEVVKFPNLNTLRYGCINVTTLTNVPIKTRLVYASLSTDETLTLDTSSITDIFSEFPDGVQLKIIAYNKSANNVMITFPWDNYVCFVKSLTVNSGQYGVITVSFKSQTEIYFEGKVEVEQSGYTGAEGIVALSNGTDYQFIRDKGTKLSDFKAAHSDYEPIGIVMIPSSCSNILYPEGDVRRGKNIIMSLAPMNYTTPDTGGTSNQYMSWGGYGVDTSLTNYNVVNYYSDGVASQSTISTAGSAYLPSDAFSGTASKVYPSIKYYDNSVSPIPSPFKMVSGELVPNEEYYTTAYSSANALSDFAGPSNTKTLIDLATAQTDWKTTGTAITNSANTGYYPAACCCARYGAPDNSTAPKGTSSFLKFDTDNTGYDYSKGVTGVWYMPACGELGFIVPHFKRNNKTMTNVNTVFDSSTAVLLGDYYFWSSSEYSSNLARLVYTYDGYVGSLNKNYGKYVRAFCAV